MKNVIFIFLCSSFLSCSDNADIEPDGANIDVGIDILYRQGDIPLFGPENPMYTADDVKLFYIESGEKVEFNRPNLDFPKGFEIKKVDSLGVNLLSIMPNHTIAGNGQTAMTLLEVGEQVDTIICEIAKPNEASSIVTKVWHNGVLKWDVENLENPPRSFGHQRAFIIER